MKKAEDRRRKEGAGGARTVTTSFTDTNAVGSAPRFYRVRVEN